MSEETPVNLPFDRIPECACDPGFGPRITPQQKLDCRMHGGQCSRNAAPSSPMTTPTPDVSDEAVRAFINSLWTVADWQRCPSTQCQRRNECANPTDCSGRERVKTKNLLLALLARAKAAEGERNNFEWQVKMLETSATSLGKAWKEGCATRDARRKALEGALKEAYDELCEPIRTGDDWNSLIAKIEKEITYGI